MPARLEDLDAALFEVMLRGLEKRLSQVRALAARDEVTTPELAESLERDGLPMPHASE